jgi:hypothetical protein
LGRRCTKDRYLSCAAARICQLLPELGPRPCNWQVRENSERCMGDSCTALSRGVGNNFVDFASLARPHAGVIRQGRAVGCVCVQKVKTSESPHLEVETLSIIWAGIIFRWQARGLRWRMNSLNLEGHVARSGQKNTSR